MDLYEIEKQANNIKKYSELLVDHYKSIVFNLTNMYNIISKTNSPLSGRLANLIGRYNEMIKIISDNYITSANQILNYVKDSNQNLTELTNNIANCVRIFNDMSQNI